jgi:membrane-bound lytic murein transglycosylase A
LRRIEFSLPVFCCFLFALAACADWFAPSRQAPLRLEATSFSDIDGWEASDPRGALTAFVRSCSSRAARPDGEALGGVGYGGIAGDWRAACSGVDKNSADAATARAFFESRFVPYRVAAGHERDGLFTGYYEPLLHGSRTLHGPYRTPLYGLPADLVTVDLSMFREQLKGQRVAGRVENGRLVPYLTRAEIARFGLANAKAFVYVDDPIDAFFLQVQGSGRVKLDDGTILRAVYAGQNGHPYTAIGKVLIEKGALTRENVSMPAIRAWLKAHPGDVQRVLDADASYVFFAEKEIGDPVLGAEGAEGVALTPGASLAIDHTIHAYGVPVWLETTTPDADAAKPDVAFRQLLVAQDTGGAITGAVRGDVYWGFGDDAAAIAGRMKSQGRMTILLPKEIAARLGARAEFRGPNS